MLLFILFFEHLSCCKWSACQAFEVVTDYRNLYLYGENTAPKLAPE